MFPQWLRRYGECSPSSGENDRGQELAKLGINNWLNCSRILEVNDD